MQKYTDATKAAVLAGWKAGTSERQLATQHQVPMSTISRWVHGINRDVVVPKTKRTLDEMAFELVEATFDGLIAIAKQAQDPGWLKDQRADGLHLMFGVAADKLIRILSAVEKRNPEDADVS